MRSESNTNHCPCGSKKLYQNCCGAFISNNQIPRIPEELMRSRYTAFTQANVAYIARTMKSPAADGFDSKKTEQWARSVEWIKLDVIKTFSKNGKGFVEFIAYFKENNKTRTIHELSEFHLIEGQWFYVKGDGVK